MKAQMVKWGNSLAVRIPKPILARRPASRKVISWKSRPARAKMRLRRATKIPTLAQIGFSD